MNNVRGVVINNRMSSLAIHGYDLLLADLHFLFIAKLKQVPFDQALRGMLRMRNEPSTLARRTRFEWMREIWNIVPSNSATAMRQMDARTGTWDQWLARVQNPEYLQLGLFQEPAVDLVRDKLVSDRTLTGFSIFPLRDARTSFDVSMIPAFFPRV
jgi:hypothetical protein